MPSNNKHEPFDPELVRELATLIAETDLSEIEVEQDDIRIRVRAELEGAADVARADSTGCSVLLGDVRRVRGWLDAVDDCNALDAESLQVNGSAPPQDAGANDDDLIGL